MLINSSNSESTINNYTIEKTEVGDSLSGAIKIDYDNFLFTADYSRENFDLIINGEDGRTLVINDYFISDVTPDLMSPDGAVLRGSVVKTLAGPIAPGSYAQQGNAQGQDPIGQVEAVSGSATVQRADGSVEPLQVGVKVFQNDVVQTADRSSLSVTFVDGTIFTLSASSRMVLDKLVFSPQGDENSAIFNLVEGTFVFIAGQLASTGDMQVNTPVATMGIRGTTVRVTIETVNGVSTVNVALNTDPDGGIGSIILSDLNGNVLANITTTDSSYLVIPGADVAQEIPRNAATDAPDQAILNEAIAAFQNAANRVDTGGNFVDGSDSANVGLDAQEGDADNDETDEQDEDSNDAQDADDTPQETDDQDGEDLQEEGSLGGSGIGEPELPEETQFAGLDETGTDELDQTVQEFQADISQSGDLGGNPDTNPLRNEETNDNDELVVTDAATNSAPSIVLPVLTTNVVEDSTIVINGFTLTDNEGDPLTVDLVAGSSFMLVPGSGVTIVSSVPDVNNTGFFDSAVLTGTAGQLNAALNGLIYRPSPDDDDGGFLRVEVSDGQLTEVSTLNVGITPVNDAPTAANDVVTRTEDANPFFGDLFLNDVDPDTGDTLMVTEVNETSSSSSTLILGQNHQLENGGIITFQENGQYTLETSGAYNDLGTGETVQHILTYSVRDSEGEVDTATLTITITGTNDGPVISGDLSTTVDEGSVITITTDDITGSDADDLDDDLVYTVTSPPGNGVLQLVTVAGAQAVTSFTQDDLVNNRIQFVHDGSETGSTSFTVSLADGGENGVSAATSTVNIQVDAVNDAPEIIGDLSVSGAEGEQILITTADINGLDPDDSGDDLVFTITTTPINGEILVNGVAASSFTQNDLVEGLVVFEHDGSDSTVGSFDVSLADGGEDGTVADTATFNVAITDANDGPINTVPLSAQGGEDSQFSISGVSVADSDSEQLTVTLSVDSGVLNIATGLPTGVPAADITNNGSGTVTLVGSVSEINTTFANFEGITYTGNTNFNGADTLTITTSDGELTDVDTVPITINSVNDAPVAFDDDFSGDEDMQITGNVLADNGLGDDSDVDGNTLTIVPETIITANEGTVTLLVDGSFTYDPASDFNGADSFDYVVEDGNGGSDIGTVNLIVTAANDAPTLQSPVNLDIVTASNAAGGIGGQVALNQGDGAFALAGLAGQAGGRGEVAIGDLNGDGANDLFFARSFNSNVIYLNDGSGGFTITGQTLGSGGSFNVALGDADNDGDLDAFVVNNGPGHVLWINDGTGLFTEQTITFGNRYRDVELGDFDGDGNLDAVIGRTQAFNSGAPTGFGGLQFNFGDGSGGFSTLTHAPSQNTDIVGVEVADFDGDGDLDIFGAADTTTPQPSQSHVILFNDGFGNFTSSGQTIASLGTQDSASGDIDGDGDEDLVITTGSTVQVLLNDGSGAFTELNIDTPGQAFSVDIADIDGNGLENVVIGDRSSDTTRVFEFDGSTLVEQTSINSFDPFGVAVGQLDASPLAISATEDGAPVEFDLSALGSDVDIVDDGSTLIYNIVGTPSEGFASINGTTLTFDPGSDFQNLGEGEVRDVTLEVQATDSDGAVSNTLDLTVTITGTNDAPVLDLDANDSSGATGANYNATFTEGDAAINIGDLAQSDIAISDIDSANIQSATITLTNILDGASEFLVADIGAITATNPNIVVSAYDPMTGTITLTGAATLSQYEGALENIRYINTSNAPDTTDRIINVVVNDGSVNSNVAVATITIIEQNEPAQVSEIGQRIVSLDNLAGGGDQFGQAVAIGADGAIIVGVPNIDNNGVDSGEVYIGNPNATGGLDVSIFNNTPGGAAGDLFGRDIAINDSGRVVVSRPSFDSGTNGNANVGAVQVFDLNGSGELVTVSTLLVPDVDANDGDFLGLAIDINNNGVIIATANGDDEGGTGAGAVYVFTDASDTSPIKLLAPDAQAGDNLGVSVAINDAGVIVVGADQGQNDASNVVNSGTAYVFEPVITGGVITSYLPGVELPTNNASANDFIGSAVDINNSGVIVVGAPLDANGEGANAGAIYIYDSPSDTNPQLIIANESSLFGSSVSLNDNGVLAIGAPGNSVNADNASSVYIYEDNGSGTFVFQQVVGAPDGTPDDAFGSDVQLNNDGTLVVGANLDDNENGVDAGAVYTFIPNDTNGNYTLSTSGIPEIEGDQGVVDIRTINLADFVTFSDADDTPFIDLDSIQVLDTMESSISAAAFFQIEGTTVSYDAGLFDLLNDGTAGIFDVNFNIVSGDEVIARSVQIRVDGTTDNTINVVDGTTAGEFLEGTANNDIINGLGNDFNTFASDILNGLGGDDILIGSNGNEQFDGGDGNDTIITGDSNPNQGDITIGSLGSDRINFGQNINGYQTIAYGNLAASFIAIVATIDFTTNTGTIEKFDNAFITSLAGTDTIIDVNNAILSPLGGFSIRGTQLSDTYNITSSQDGFFSVVAGRGNDIINLESGLVRVEFRVEASGTSGFSGATQGANVNLGLADNQVINDGFGFTDDINFTGDFSSGSGNSVELRGTDFDDILIGGEGDDRFIGERGNDIIDGGAGIDLIRLDRSGAASVSIDLEVGTGVGFFDNTIFNYTLSNIENIRGSNVGVDSLQGDNANNVIEGRSGIDFINGRGGDDRLIGDSPSGTPDDSDVFIFDPFSGNDTIEGFTIGQDRIAIVDSSLSGVGTAEFDSFTFDGTDTIIQFDGGASVITVVGVDLVNVADPEVSFIFNGISAVTGVGIPLGAETIEGTTSNDLIQGTSGDDTINGGAGDDVIIGGGATDGSLPGGIFFVEGEIISGDVIDAGAGDDLVVVQAGSSVVVGGAGDDRIQSSRTIYVSDEENFADFLQVDYSSAAEGIVANLTSEVRVGLQSQQVSDGLGGIDTLGGVTRVRDSQFNDVFFVDASDPNANGRATDVSLTGGDDMVTFIGGGNASIDFASASEGVSVNLSTQTATDVDLTNGNQLGNNTIIGANRINGSAFDDVIVGDDNSNRLRGRDGDDTLNGGNGGFNIVDHFTSINRVVVDLSQNATLNDGQGGVDTLINIQGAFGNHGSDLLIGDDVNNSLHGFGNSDVLVGRGGDDFLEGDTGNIARGNGVLTSGGNDFLAGGLGADTLIGGVGADVFAISDLSGASFENFDFIRDFNTTQGDRIDISDFGTFGSTTDFGGIFFDVGLFRTDIDLDGDGLSDFAIENFNLTALSQGDQDAAFIFDVIGGTVNINDTINGTMGDDYIRPVSTTTDDQVLAFQGSDTIFASLGNDTIDLSFSPGSLVTADYSNQSSGITVTFSGFDDIAEVSKDGGAEDIIRNYTGISAEGGLTVVGSNNNDIFQIDPSIEALANIDGGLGQDMLSLLGSNQVLDFSELEIISGVEEVDIGGNGNELTLDADNVVNFSDQVNEQIDGLLASSTGEDALLITGGAADILILSNSSSATSTWQLDAADSAVATGFDVYNFTDGTDTFAQIVVEEEVVVNVVA